MLLKRFEGVLMIRTIHIQELNEVTNYIKIKNTASDKRSFFMSQSDASIKNDLEEAIKSNLAFGLFNSHLKGVIVCYKHPHEYVMDCAGPFYDSKEDAFSLINYLLTIHRDYRLNFFFDHQHQELVSIVQTYPHHFHGYEFQMNLDRNDYLNLELNPLLSPLQKEFHQDFINLFDQIFPDSYISPQDIIFNIDQLRDVYIVTDNGSINGYLVVKSYPLFPKKKTIEMVGVKASKRNQGIGRSILNQALHIIFSNQDIKFVDLIVDLDNQKALALYEQFGFKVQHQGIHMSIQNH